MFYISANLCRGVAEWAQRKIYFGTICYLKCVTFLEKSQSMTFSEIKKGGFPMIFNQSKTSHFYYTIV